ncbi:MAG TPA: GMC family oxidoreductase N-terminal domain-containing protein [Polyangiales bacterium]
MQNRQTSSQPPARLRARIARCVRTARSASRGGGCAACPCPATEGGTISILQGRAVGGTTVVNWTTCFRTPENVIQHWHEHHGVTGLTHAALVPHWERVEQRLRIQQMQLAQLNANNRVLWNGAEALGWSKRLLARNVTHCAHTGYCGLGCPIDAKQSMLVTLVPDAVRAGADVYANAWVQKVTTQGRKAHEVVALMRDPKTDRLNGRTLRVAANIVVLCGGAPQRSTGADARRLRRFRPGRRRHALAARRRLAQADVQVNATFAGRPA